MPTCTIFSPMGTVLVSRCSLSLLHFHAGAQTDPAVTVTEERL